MFTLEIRTDNAAFEGDAAPTEIARLLHKLAVELVRNRLHDFESGKLMDHNGNTCASWTYRKAEQSDSVTRPIKPRR